MAKVNAAAFNAVQNKISAVLGTPSNSTANLGYSIAVGSQAVSQGAKIYGNDLNLVIQDVNTALTHQTGLDSGLDTYPAKKIIELIDLTKVSTKVDVAYTNRTTVGVGQLNITTSDSYSNGTPWKVSHTYRTRFDWGSNAEFRGWSNLGGFILIGCSLSGGSGSNQDASWTNVLAAMGNLVFNGDAALQEAQTRNGSFPNGNLYNILGAGQSGASASQAFRILASDTNYTGNKFTLYIYPYGGTNAFNCTGFEMLFELLDNHVATGVGPDLVDGTLGISVSTYYAYNKVPTVTSLGSTIG